MPEHPVAHTPAAVKWGGILVAAFLVILLVSGAILERNANALRGAIARTVSRHLGRTVRIDGTLTLNLLTLHPAAVADGVKLGNPSWAGQGDMVQIGRLKVALSLPALLRGHVVLPRLDVQDADVNLIRDASDRANWEFTPRSAPQAHKPANLPVVQSLHIDRGHLVVADAIRRLRFQGTLSASQGGGSQVLQLDGTGDMNGAPFKFSADGDPLFTADRTKPYRFKADLRAGATHLWANATLTKPFDLGAIDAALNASGDDLADVYYVSGLALPNTSPYTLTARIRRDGTRIYITDLGARLAKSDVHGNVTIETGGQRPALSAQLVSHSLDLIDIAPALGASTRSARPGESSLAKGDKTAKRALGAPARRDPAAAARVNGQASVATDQSPPGGLLLPDAQLQLQRIRNMDASVHFQAASVIARKIPMRKVAFQLKLDRGIMMIQPLSFVLPQGRLSGGVRIDASRDTPDVALDARLDSIELAQFHGRNSAAPADGTLVGRLVLHGEGRSVHAAAATANGIITAVVPHGEVREAFAELTGIDVARGLGLLLAHNQQQAPLRCGVANFRANDGILTAQDIVFDTEKVLITGKGDIDLRTEKLALTLYGQPKKFRFFRVKSPIALGGTLRKPTVGLKSGNTPGQAGVAVALGTLLTPVAAALAFIDPGLAKSADCSALLDKARQRGAPLKQASAEPSAPRTRAR